jgi:hypothetical protein
VLVCSSASQALRSTLNKAIDDARVRHAAAGDSHTQSFIARSLTMCARARTAAKRVAIFGFDPDASTPDIVTTERVVETVVDVKEEIINE